METDIYRSFRRELIQQSDSYDMYKCTFPTSEGTVPNRAWLKVFKVNREEAMRDLSMLSAFKEFGESLAVVKPLHHRIAQGQLNIFLDWFDCMLAQDIAKRKRRREYWTEAELCTHMFHLAEVLFKLHAMRVVHRNISPDTVFVRGKSLLLGHFDDSKHVPIGVSQRNQTIRGTQQYLTPQSYEAFRSGQQTTYEISIKDDIWGLGRVMLDMATLDCNVSIADYFSRSQEDLHAYIAKLLESRYSSELIRTLSSILSLDPSRRPLAEDILSVLYEMREKQPCSGCNRKEVPQTWSCGHVYCEDCLLVRLANATVSEVAATCHCGSAINDVVLRMYSQQCRKIGELANDRQISCPKCSVKYRKVRVEAGLIKSYKCKCACGASFCSLCGDPKAHRGFFGSAKPCPQLPAFPA